MRRELCPFPHAPVRDPFMLSIAPFVMALSVCEHMHLLSDYAECREIVLLTDNIDRLFMQLSLKG